MQADSDIFTQLTRGADYLFGDGILKFLSQKIFFMTDMRTWDHPDAKFMLSAPPPLRVCFLWQFEVFRIWNFTHSHKISCQTQSLKHFVMIPTGF